MAPDDPWQRAVTDLARALSGLLQQSSPAGDPEADQPVDLDVVLTARAAVLDTVVHVITDLVPRVQQARWKPATREVPISVLQRDPIGALGRVLHARPRPELDCSPSELLEAAHADTAEPSSVTTRAWAAVGRRALLADRAWAAVRGQVILDGDAAWGAVGEAAALAEAITILDDDLARALPADRAYAGLAVRAFDAAAGLRIAARETLTLAGQGHSDQGRHPRDAVHEIAADTLSPDRLRMTPAPPATDLARGLRRITALLSEEPDLTPRHVRLCALVARDLSLATATATATAAGPSDHSGQRELFATMVRELHHAGNADRGEVALTPVALRALELQLHELHTIATRALSDPAPANPVHADHASADHSCADRSHDERHAIGPTEAALALTRLPALVEVLATTTQKQIANGQWAMPDRRDGDRLAYTLASASDPERQPDILRHLEAAMTAAQKLSPGGSPASEAGLASVVRHLGLDRWDAGPSLRPWHPADPRAVPYRAVDGPGR